MTDTVTVSNSPTSSNPDIPVATRVIGSAQFQLFGNGLVPEAYDQIVMSYTGTQLTSIVYKLASVTIGTLTLSYTGDQITGIVRT